jgi:hypothetical protein
MKTDLLQVSAVMLAAALAAPAAQMVITVKPPQSALDAHELTVLQGKTRIPVLSLERLAGEKGGIQLLVALDDSTRSASLGIQLPELRRFVASAPAATEIAIGYIRDGGLVLAQPFTIDHARAAAALRLPESVPGVNASPYFALSEMVRHWPSREPSDRRAVLFFTDGVDRYFTDPRMMEDPYVNAAIEDALKNGVAVYSIYLRGAGPYGTGDWTTTMAQSRLIQVADETGGFAYQEGFTDPVSIVPFLRDFHTRIENQYRVTFNALNGRGAQPVKVRSENPGVKVSSPSRIYVQ